MKDLIQFVLITTIGLLILALLSGCSLFTEEKVVYSYNRDLLKGNKTDEDLPIFPKNDKKNLSQLTLKKKEGL